MKSGSKARSTHRRIPAGNLEGVVIERLQRLFSNQAELLDAIESANIGGSGQRQWIQRGRRDPDWSIWRLSSRTLWNPAPNLDVGIEVGYTKLNTAWAGLGDVVAANGLARGIYAIQDQNVWTTTFRVQRNFWP